MPADEPIPCVVLTHGRDYINRLSLGSIIAADRRLDIEVIHNPSPSEDGSFIAFARECAAQGKIRSFTLFDQNVSNNALFLFLLASGDRYGAERVVLSDGDILAPDAAIEEELAILDAHPDVFACGLRLDASAWDESLVIKKDFVERFNTRKFEATDYLNTATGMWMTMFRGPELMSIVTTLRDNGLRLTDANFKQLGAALFQKQWVATKTSIGRELNREQPDYHDAKAVSTQAFSDHSPEPRGSKYATWNHDLIAAATEWRGGEERRVRFAPLPPAVPRFRKRLEDDPVVRALTSGQLHHDRGYLANHLMAATNPGLAFVVCEDQCLSGLPHLAPDRSALFIAAEPEPGAQLASLSEIDFGPVLMNRESAECRSILTTLRRFLAPGSLLHGIGFCAETVRSNLAQGKAPSMNHLPPSLASLAGEAAAAQARGNASEQLLGRLWSDEAFAQWLQGHGSLSVSRSVKNPHLAYFRALL